MKTKPNTAVRELRRIIGQTQREFAAMIGASRDTVVSWEAGRNKLSAAFARRIRVATGADEKPLLKGKGPLTTYVPRAGHRPFTAERFEEYRKSYWGRTDEEAAKTHLRHCTDTLRLLFLAAAKPGGEQQRYRLPAVVDSFIQWCEQTRASFELEKEIDGLLWERRYTLELTKSYKAWRQNERDDPEMCRMMGFKDDPRKGDSESLRLTKEVAPVWQPGRGMRPQACDQWAEGSPEGLRGSGRRAEDGSAKGNA